MQHLDLLAKITAAPDDDAPRRVYADWLLDRDDPRGEFIVLQCELHHLTETDPRRSEMLKREAEMLTAFGRDWIAECGFPATHTIKAVSCSQALPEKGGAVIRFCRGFADAAKLNALEFLPQARTLLGSPLRTLMLTGLTRLFTTELEQFVALPESASLCALRLKRPQLSDDALSMFVNAPFLASISDLDLCEPYPGGWAPLAKSAWVGQLRRFVLTGAMTQGIDTVLRATPQLISLSLRDTDARPLWGLFQSEHVPHLKVLDMRNSRADDALVSAIASSGRPLTHFDLRGNRTLGEEAIRSLVKSRRLSGLVSLQVTERHLSFEQVTALRKRFAGKLHLDPGW